MKNTQRTAQQAVQIARLQASTMSGVLILLALFVAVAASRLPQHLANEAYFQLMAVGLFGILILVGVVHNLHTHFNLWRLQRTVNASGEQPQASQSSSASVTRA